MISIISDIEALKKFQNEWDKIVEHCPTATPFQSFGYITSYLSTHDLINEKLYFVAVKDSVAKLWFAVFPFVIDKRGVLRFINYTDIDFCGPLILPEYDNYNSYKEVAEFIESESAVKGLELYNMKGSDSLIDALSPFFPYCIASNCNHYSVVSISKEDTDRDCIDGIQSIRAIKKKNHRRVLRTLPEGFEFNVLSKSSGDDFPDSQINTLCESMISSGIRERTYLSDSTRSFWKQLFDGGLISVALVTIAGEAKAANLMFYDAKCEEYIQWVTLYVDKKLNLIINLKIAEYIYAQGGASINFARGIYDYKLDNFHPDVKPLFCVRIAKTRWGHFRNILSTALHYSKPIIKSWLGR